jgi:hypothetical protein
MSKHARRPAVALRADVRFDPWENFQGYLNTGSSAHIQMKNVSFSFT